MALVMGAEHQQVGATLLHLFQHDFGRLALAQAQLAAGRGEFGEAAVEGLFDALAFRVIQLGVEDVQEGQFGAMLASQLGGMSGASVSRTIDSRGRLVASSRMRDARE